MHLPRFPWILIFALGLGTWTASRSSAQYVIAETPTPTLRPGDEIWIVSSRRLSSCHHDLGALDVRRYVGGLWYPSDTESVLSGAVSHPSKSNVILVHGNSWSFSKAVLRGMQTYQELMVPCRDKPPVRFIIWTWPSDKVSGPIRDIRVKAKVSEQHAIHLARFIQNLPSSNQVAVIGFSFGSRLALGALHLLGGGDVHGKRVERQNATTAKVNLTLIAPAIRNDTLVSTMSRAYGQINHLFVMYNSRDRFLSLFRLTRFGGKNQALGYTGVRGLTCLPSASIRVNQFDAATTSGHNHDYLEYIRDRSVEQHVRHNLFFAPNAR